MIEDSDSSVVVRDRGVIRRTAIFDTLGDGARRILLEEAIYVRERTAPGIR